MGITITDVRVFDGETMSRAVAVRLEGEVIVAAGSPGIAGPGDDYVDGQGGTLIPGLIDAHVHLLPGAPSQAMSFGVTTILDMFSRASADTFSLGGRGRISPGAPADLVLTRGRPDETITDSATIEAVWKDGHRQGPEAYSGSPAEAAGIDFLDQQTRRVIAAVRERYPQLVPPEGAP